jgi:predicted nucleic acid-binding protein
MVYRYLRTTADSTIYATAKSRGAKVVSGDPHFKGLAEVEFLN